MKLTRLWIVCVSGWGTRALCWSCVPPLLPSFKRKTSKSFMKEQIKKGWGTIPILLVSLAVVLLPEFWSALEWGDHILNKLVLCHHIFPLIWTDRNPINLNIWATVLNYRFQSTEWKKTLMQSVRRPPFAEDTDQVMLALALNFTAFLIISAQ